MSKHLNLYRHSPLSPGSGSQRLWAEPRRVGASYADGTLVLPARRPGGLPRPRPS